MQDRDLSDMKLELKAHGALLEALAETQAEHTGEIAALRADVGGLRDEVGGLRDEVGGLRDEVGGLRDEVGGLRADVNDLKVDVVLVKVALAGNTLVLERILAAVEQPRGN